MPFLDRRNDQLPPLGPGMSSGGPTTGFGENFWQTFTHQRRVDSQFALEAELYNQYQENLSRFRELTGEEPEFSVGWSHMGEAYRRHTDPNMPYIDPRYDHDYDQMQKFDERVSELKEQFPELQTFAEMVEGVGNMFREVDEQTSQVTGQAGLGGMLGGFAGGIVGSFSLRDPVLLGSLFIPNPGATVARRILTEIAIGSGTEAFVQYGTVQPRREEFDLPEQSALASIIFAGVGSGVFRGAIEGAGPGFRALESRLHPDRAQARVFRDTMDEALAAPLSDLMRRMSPQRLTDDELLAAVQALPQTPSVRAAAQGLEQGIEFARANPYGNSHSAELRFSRDLAQVRAEFEGEIVPPHLRTDTAVGRFIENRLIEMDRTPEANIGRQQAPELYARVDEAQARVDEIEMRIAELEEGISARSMSDSVGLLDEIAGVRVREIEAELDTAIPRPRREALEDELNTIVESLDPEQITRAESDFRIGPQRELRAARNARRTALKNLRRAQRPITDLESRIARDAEQREIVGAILNPQVMRRQVVRDLARDLDEVEPRIPEITETLVQRVQEPDVRMIDLDGEHLIPEDFRVALDEDGTQTMTARQIMEDLAEDTRMLEAMRSCAL